MAIITHNQSEIEALRRSARVVMEILALLRAAVRPGVTTAELDGLAASELAARGATSNFKGYSPGPAFPPYPGVLCASVNDEVVHGVPGLRTLAEGDIITLDFGAILDGWHGDSAITVPVGAISPAAQRLLDVTEEALRRGIEQARAGRRVSAISAAVQSYVEGEGFAIVRQYVGHGIGRSLHEEPSVPNYVVRGQPDPVLRPGMVLCIEPMVNVGTAATRERADRWTVATADGSLSAHFEHMVAITTGAPDVLTAL